jgi:signal transduction histidine kinase
VVWQWLLTAFAMAFGLTVSVLLAATRRSSFWDVVLGCVLLGCVGIVCYGAYAFGTLLWGVHKMNNGSLDHKIPTKYLFGSFRDFAVELNKLSDSAVVAAQNQLKSERMKTELITNVTHDIKTPLTSLINYVDLLQKPRTEQEEAAYLEVLSRQSLRLKKLIDDLMEMSKASTGNLTVDIGAIDAVEAVNQALGEFSGKFAKARLIPVFAASQEPVMMHADGRLVWRVLSNLLGNAVKYAMPGTRVYIDTARVDGRVLISIKNISAEPLNVSSEELMERFVRGDASRNTEGSGLGLNIAKSLMEVQKGQLSLLVDGDLFKVTLLFPEVE